MGTYELKREVATVIQRRRMEKLERKRDEMCV
jgi:hypothetical protein